jgi:hypothetical protein
MSQLYCLANCRVGDYTIERTDSAYIQQVFHELDRTRDVASW